MVEHGDNLSVSRDIDFVVVTPNNEAAQSLAEIVRAWGFKAMINRADVVPSLPWEVVIVSHMLPTHGEITRLEQKLAGEAARIGGRNDGWGCLQQD